MEDFFFVFLYLLVLFVTYKIIRMAHIDIFRVSVPSIFFLYYGAAAYIGILPLYFGWNEHAIDLGVTDQELIMRMFFLSSISIILIAVSLFLISRASQRNNLILLKKDLLTRPLSFDSMAVIICLFLISSIVLFYYIRYLPNPPILWVLRGKSHEAMYARTTLLTTNLPLVGKSSYYAIFCRMIMPFLCLVIFANALIAHRKTMWIIVLLTFIVASFGAIVDTAKGPLIGLIFGYVLVYMLLKNKRLTPKLILFIVLIIAFFSSLMIVYFMGASGSNITAVILSIFNRIVSGNLVPAYHVLDMFQHGDYLWGSSFPNPRGIFPYKQFLLDEEIWLKMSRLPWGSLQLYSAPSCFWADIYANFGVAGVLILSPFIGMFLYLVQLLLSGLSSSPVKLALIAWCSIYYMGIAGKSFFSYAWDYYLVAILLISFIILMFNSKKQRRSDGRTVTK